MTSAYARVLVAYEERGVRERELDSVAAVGHATKNNEEYTLGVYAGSIAGQQAGVTKGVTQQHIYAVALVSSKEAFKDLMPGGRRKVQGGLSFEQVHRVSEKKLFCFWLSLP